MLREQKVPTGAIQVISDLPFLHAKSNGVFSRALAAGAASRVSAAAGRNVSGRCK